MKQNNPHHISHSVRCMFNLEKDRILKFMEKGKHHRVLFQFPEGLKPQGFKLAKEIEEASGAEIVLSADACYGACDLAIEAKRVLNADAIVHFGHSPIIGHDSVDMLYVQAEATIGIDEAVRKALNLLGEEKKIGLATVVQHKHQLKHAAEILEKHGKERISWCCQNSLNTQ